MMVLDRYNRIILSYQLSMMDLAGDRAGELRGMLPWRSGKW